MLVLQIVVLHQEQAVHLDLQELMVLQVLLVHLN